MDYIDATAKTADPIDHQEHVDAIYGAAELIRRNALDLRAAHTRADDDGDWCGDDDTRREYEDEINLADYVDKAAESYINLQTERDALLAALVGLVEEKQPLGIDRETYITALELIVSIELREAES